MVSAVTLELSDLDTIKDTALKNFEVRGEAFRQAVNAIDGITAIGGGR